MDISRRKFIIGGIALGSGLLLDSFWIEKYIIKRKDHYLNGASRDKKRLTFVQISDLHLKSFKIHYRDLAKRINRIDPDLILFTGDSIETEKGLPLLDRFLAQFRPGIKKYAVLGNWEYLAEMDFRALAAVYNKHNTTLLINKAEELSINGKSVRITGFDSMVGGHPDIPAAFRDYREADVHIVLNHCPAFTDVLAKEKGDVKIDLVLSGHTHGGQITLLGFAPFTPRGSGRYLSGWYKKMDPIMYVSNGIGTTILPMRLGARAEFGVFHF